MIREKEVLYFEQPSYGNGLTLPLRVRIGGFRGRRVGMYIEVWGIGTRIPDTSGCGDVVGNSLLI